MSFDVTNLIWFLLADWATEEFCWVACSKAPFVLGKHGIAGLWIFVLMVSFLTAHMLKALRFIENQLLAVLENARVDERVYHHQSRRTNFFGHFAWLEMLKRVLEQWELHILHMVFLVNHLRSVTINLLTRNVAGHDWLRCYRPLLIRNRKVVQNWGRSFILVHVPALYCVFHKKASFIN